MWRDGEKRGGEERREVNGLAGEKGERKGGGREGREEC